MSHDLEPQIKVFKSAAAWEKWLAGHFDFQPGVWLQMAKKASGIVTVSYDEALDVALCYGWIDGIVKKYDDQYFIQKFTPRRSRSLWSKRNVGKALELIKSERMQPSGLVQVEAAQADGRWQAAYDSQKDMVIPDDFIEAVQKNTKAKSRFETLNKANLFAIGWRLQTATSPEVRARRFTALLEKLEKGEAL